MEVESLKDHLAMNKDQLIQSILNGSYRPNPVRRVEIPKEKGKRKIGIPTVVDRVIQLAIAQIYHLFTRNSSHRIVMGSDPDVIHIWH